jgi:hypothetical protein
MGRKLRPVKEDGVIRGYVFHCPGCEHGHIFNVTGALTWSFNGNLESPTFQPSLLNTCPNHPEPKNRRCHLNLTAGRVFFHNDCAHSYAGKNYDLPDVE